MDFELLARNSKAGVALALLCAASMWFYVDRVLIPYQRSDAEAHSRPRGNLSDLYPRWLGARELLLHHRNPYSPEITREIQRGYYGRELDPSRPHDPIDQQAFAYPAYVAFLLAPSVAFPFEAVRVGFQWTLLAITAAGVWLWLRAIGWRPKPATLTMVGLLALGSFPVVQGLKLQQLTLFVAFLVALSAALLVRERLFLAGFVLAIATIKPQLVAPLLLCLLLWTASNWAQRQRFFWGFALTTAALLAASELVLPGWIGDFRFALRDYRRYAGGQSLLEKFLSPGVGQMASGAVLGILLVVCWRFRKAQAQSREFQCMLATVLAITLIVIPMFAPYNQVLLLPAILLIVRQGRELWHRDLLSKAACSLTMAVVGWPWLASLALTIASLRFGPVGVERGWTIPLYTSLAIPFVVLVPLGSLVHEAWQNRADRSALAKAG